MQGLGGKFGDKICNDLKVQYMAELHQFSKDELLRHCDERNSKWLFNLARGIDLEAVTPRLVPKSISCSKMFPRQNALADLSSLNHWLHEIVKDVVERVEEDEFENNRRPKQIVVSFTQTINNADISSTRTINFTTNDEDKIVNDAIDVIKRNTPKFLKSSEENLLSHPIKFLGFNVCKFESLDAKRGKTIEDMFKRSFQKNQDQTINKIQDKEVDRTVDEPNNPIANCSSNKEEVHNNFLANYHVDFNEDDCDSSDVESESCSQNDALIAAANQMNRNLQEHLLVSPGPSTSTDRSYEQSYAEYYQPAEQDTLKIECSQCGKMVTDSEMQVHMDGHLAFQLNQEQRNEFDNRMKRSHLSSTPVKKKQKIELKKSSNKKIETASIQKFFAKKIESTPGPSTSTSYEVEVERCAECNKAIPIVDLFEHMDYHAAKRLHDELMKTEAKTNRSSNNNTVQKYNNNLSAGKGKKSNKKSVNLKNSAVRNISAFFSNN